MPAARSFLVLAALLVVTVTAAGAAPGDCRLIRGATTPETEDDVSICRQDVWIHQAATKAGNLAASGAPNAGDFPSWDTTQPTVSVQSGAGAGYLSLAAFSQNVNRYDGRAATTFRGSFTGHLDNMALTLYLFSPARQIDPTQAVSLRLTIDGVTAYQTGAEADRPPLSPAGDAVLQTQFAFDNIHKKMEALGITGAPDTEHTIELVISQWFTVNDNAIYVYDTSEVPAGIVFNLESSPIKAFPGRIDVSLS